MSRPVDRFSGFSATRPAFTPVPAAFFSHVLPRIEDPAELKVTLHVVWLLHNKKGDPRFVTWDELLSDQTLLASVSVLSRSPHEALGRGLEKAVARGTLLHLALESPGTVDNIYFLNDGPGRRAVARVRAGDIRLELPRPRRPASVLPDARSRVAVLYEQSIGVLTPGIADELRLAEHEFGQQPVAEAIGEAVRYNKRHWTYVKRVLENRRASGGKRDDGEED